MIYPITRGDTGTPLKFRLGDASGPWDLTGATVTFSYSVNGVVKTKAVTPDADQVNNRGVCSSLWGANELDEVPEGVYACQAVAVWPGTPPIRRYAPPKAASNFVVRAPL